MSYQIKRWDVVIYGNSNIKKPVIYITPDSSLLELAANSIHPILIKISGTNTLYDGKMVKGVINKSSDVPNYRPNFFDQTGYYIISLDADWYGYPHPSSQGEITIDQTLEQSPIYNQYYTNKKLEDARKNEEAEKPFLEKYTIFFLMVILLFLSMMFFLDV